MIRLLRWSAHPHSAYADCPKLATPLARRPRKCGGTSATLTGRGRQKPSLWPKVALTSAWQGRRTINISRLAKILVHWLFAMVSEQLHWIPS
jgi:hypothetical protein